MKTMGQAMAETERHRTEGLLILGRNYHQLLGDQERWNRAAEASGSRESRESPGQDLGTLPEGQE